MMPAKGPVRSKSLYNNSTKASSNDPQFTVKDCLHWPIATVSAATKIKTKRIGSTSRCPSKSKEHVNQLGQNKEKFDNKKPFDSKVHKSRGNSDESTDGAKGLATKLESFYLADDDDLTVCYANEVRKKKGNKTKQSDGGVEEEPCLGDLLSYRYFREAQGQKQLDDEMKKLAKKNAAKASKERRNDLKSTKTSQLRSIAVSSDCDGTSKEELWKMSKFANVQSKISTGLSKDNADVKYEDQDSPKEGEILYDRANDTSRFKEQDSHTGFSPPGGVYVSQGFSTDFSSSNSFSYEYLPSTNANMF